MKPFIRPTLKTTNNQIPPEPTAICEFNPSDMVYVFGEGYKAHKTYPIYVVEDKVWKNGDIIPQRIVGTLKHIRTDSEGELLVKAKKEWKLQAVWEPPLIPGKYDIIIDINRNGIYDAGIDVLCDNNIQVTAGLFVIPETPLGTLTILIVSLIGLAIHKKKQISNTIQNSSC